MKIFPVSILFCLLACNGRAQMPGPPAENAATDRLSVRIDLKRGTQELRAPATVDILAEVRLRPKSRAGGAVRVEFFANARRLGFGKAVWHEAVRSTALPGSTAPQPLLAAEFYPAEWVWKKVPAGACTLTARATWTNGLAAVSAPLKIKVLP